MKTISWTHPSNTCKFIMIIKTKLNNNLKNCSLLSFIILIIRTLGGCSFPLFPYHMPCSHYTNYLNWLESEVLNRYLLFFKIAGLALGSSYFRPSPWSSYFTGTARLCDLQSLILGTPKSTSLSWTMTRNLPQKCMPLINVFITNTNKIVPQTLFLLAKKGKVICSTRKN